MKLLLLGVLVGIVIGWLLVTRKKEPKFLSSNEYWVYLPGDRMPPLPRVRQLPHLGRRRLREIQRRQHRRTRAPWRSFRAARLLHAVARDG